MKEQDAARCGVVQLEAPGLHVVHVAVEMAPICKVGGLGDVVTALGRAVQEQGHMVEVILPRCLIRPAQHAHSLPCPTQRRPMQGNSVYFKHIGRQTWWRW